MSPTRQLTVTLPEEVVRAVEARVAAGEYASASEVVLDGLMQPTSSPTRCRRSRRGGRALAARGGRADLSGLSGRSVARHPAEEVFDGLERRYLARKAKQKNNIKA